MPITIPATDPALLYCPPRSNGGVVLIENTSVAWSVRLTRRYATAKGIPLANIISVAMGTNTDYWDPTDNLGLYQQLLLPLANKFNAVTAHAVLRGPGCPSRVLVRNSTDGVTYTGGAIVAVDLKQVTGAARYFRDGVLAALDPDILAGTTGSPALLVLLSAVGLAPFDVIYDYADWALGIGTGSPPVDPLYLTQYEGLNGEKFYLPTDLAMDTLGAVTNRVISSGRIGQGVTATAYQWPPPAEYLETEQQAGMVMEAALRYGAGLSPANRYHLPIHVQLAANGFAMQTLAYLCSQLTGWGYTRTYAWRTGSVAAMETYAPVAGGLHTQAELNAGGVKNVPYQLMIGDGSNTELFTMPYIKAWQPAGGGGSVMGPSHGWGYAVLGLQRGGSGGCSNSFHVTSNLYEALYPMAHCLLRGMSWAEAQYWTQNTSYGMPVFGDPLQRPYPQ